MSVELWRSRRNGEVAGIDLNRQDASGEPPYQNVAAQQLRLDAPCMFIPHFGIPEVGAIDPIACSPVLVINPNRHGGSGEPPLPDAAELDMILKWCVQSANDSITERISQGDLVLFILLPFAVNNAGQISFVMENLRASFSIPLEFTTNTDGGISSFYCLCRTIYTR
jgi:hypothetical protein